MNKYLILLSILFVLLLSGCTNNENTDKKSTTDNSSEESIKESNFDNDITIEGFGSIKKALKKAYNYNDEEFKNIVDVYSKDNYNYENFIPGESEKISFYQKNAILHGEEKSQVEDTYFIYFFSPTCTYCNEFYSTLLDYSKKSNAYPLYKLNVDILENYFAWEDYNISGTPTLILYDKANNKILNKFSGVVELDKLPLIK